MRACHIEPSHCSGLPSSLDYRREPHLPEIFSPEKNITFNDLKKEYYEIFEAFLFIV
jgi:hypothetical protein